MNIGQAETLDIGIQSSQSEKIQGNLHIPLTFSSKYDSTIGFDEIIDIMLAAIEIISFDEIDLNSQFENTYKKLQEMDELMLKFLKTGLSESSEATPKQLPCILHYNYKEQLGSLLNVIPKLQNLDKYKAIQREFREKVIFMKELFSKLCSEFRLENRNDLEGAYKQLIEQIKEFERWCWDMYFTD